MEKKCFKCGEIKPLSDFYTHPRMKDGHLGKCKSCTKIDVAKHHKSPSGIENRKRYYESVKSDPYKIEQLKRYRQASRERFPERHKACTALNNAVRDGRITKMPCEICGSPKSQGHHSDYAKPLVVRWLCAAHHRELHKKHIF